MNEKSIKQFIKIHGAISENNAEFAEEILKSGLDPNETPPTSTITGLMSHAVDRARFTIIGEEFVMIDLLMKYKGNLNLVDKHGNVPIKEAVRGRFNFKGTATQGANVNYGEEVSESVLIKALTSGSSFEVVEMILKAGALRQ